MPRQLCLRALTEDEKQEIGRLIKSRTEPVRRVQRAKIIQAMLDDPNLPAGEAGRLAGYRSIIPGPLWVKRFNAGGLAGLEDESRRGRPRTHDEKVRSALIGLAIRKPDTLGYPFKLWTLERLQSAFQEQEGVHLSDSTIWEWLAAEGLAWKRQESWFHEAEKHDPEFVEKRGALSRLT
jgi:transposase